MFTLRISAQRRAVLRPERSKHGGRSTPCAASGPSVPARSCTALSKRKRKAAAIKGVLVSRCAMQGEGNARRSISQKEKQGEVQDKTAAEAHGRAAQSRRPDFCRRSSQRTSARLYNAGFTRGRPRRKWPATPATQRAGRRVQAMVGPDDLSIDPCGKPMERRPFHKLSSHGRRLHPVSHRSRCSG